MNHATGPYRGTTCRERELTLENIHTFLTTQGHGGPPRMRDHLNAGSTSETTQTWKTIHSSTVLGPGSIPGRDKFPGWGLFRGFSSPVRQMSGSFKPPNIIWPSSSSFIMGANDLRCSRALKPQIYIHKIHTIHAAIYSNKANMKEWLCRPNGI